MISQATPRARARLVSLAVQLAILIAAGVAAYLYPTHKTRAEAVLGAALVMAVIAVDSAGFAVLAVPGVLLIQRVGGGAISLSDVLLTLGALTAVMAGALRRLPPQGRLLLRALSIYLICLLASIIANQNVRADLEWLHRLVLVGGSVSVGAWLVFKGLHRATLRLLVGLMAALAAVAVVTCLIHGFKPAYPLGYQKNDAGSLIATTFIVLLGAPGVFALKPRLRTGLLVTLAAGLLSTQSRGAMLAVIAASFIWYLRAPRAFRRKTAKFAVVAALGFGYFIFNSVEHQLQSQPGTINSITQRYQVESQTRQLFYKHPVTGVGLRFYKTPEYSTYQPPNNLIDEALAESGAPGLLGLLILATGAIVALKRTPGELATVALAVTVGRFMHGLVDIYWVAGTTTLPWIIAGMGLGAAAVSNAESDDAGRTLEVPAEVAG